MKIIVLVCAFVAGAVSTMTIAYFYGEFKQTEMRRIMGEIPDRIVDGDFYANKEVGELSWKMAHDFTFPVQKKLMLELVGKVRNIDLSDVPYSRQSTLVWKIYMTQREIWDRVLSPNATGAEVWEYKLEGLRWYKSQVERLRRISAEDASIGNGNSGKYNKAIWKNHNDHMHWKTCLKKVHDAFSLNLKQCVQDAESDRYSDEFRAWCFREIEKIIGRPLTDDDIMFKADVLRRRAERKKCKDKAAAGRKAGK